MRRVDQAKRIRLQRGKTDAATTEARQDHRGDRSHQ
jgi:hypothetical protein